MRRIKSDCASYELRGAQVRKARRDYECDYHQCYMQIMGQSDGPDDFKAIWAGQDYAYVSTGLRFCSDHYSPTDIIEVPNA